MWKVKGWKITKKEKRNKGERLLEIKENCWNLKHTQMKIDNLERKGIFYIEWSIIENSLFC